MLTIFNRAELLFTQSGEQFHRAEAALKQAKIEYSIKMQDSSSRPGDRARISSFGVRPVMEYRIYVNKKKLEEARYCLARGRD